MKLQNKKTGEIVEAHEIDLIDNYAYLKIFRAGDYDTKQYNSLAELNEEWEDYEEPKQNVLRIMILTLTNFIENEPSDNVDLDDCKNMLTKLKAWQRLKSKGFVWQGWEEGAMDNGTCIVGLQIPENNWDTDVVKDLDLLFSEEEE